MSLAQEQTLHEVLARRPEDQGYVGTTWTVALLRHWLKRQGNTPLSDTTLRRHLHRVSYVWKRFRYVLRNDPRFSKKAKVQHQVARSEPSTVILAQDETDPYGYLRAVLTRLLHMTNRQIPEVTPEAWCKARRKLQPVS